MKEIEREARVIEYLREKPFASVKDLRGVIDASDATIRRDIARLDEEGKARKVFGGIASIKDNDDKLDRSLFPPHKSAYSAEKSAIGKKAAEYCTEGDSVILSGGSTTFRLAESITDISLSVLTNSTHIAFYLWVNGRARIVVPGGEMHRRIGAIHGANTDNLGFFASKYFLGAQALSADGMMESHPLLIESIQNSIKISDEVIVMCDSSKFDLKAHKVACPMSRISRVITDTNISKASHQMLIENGINVDLVEPDADAAD